MRAVMIEVDEDFIQERQKLGHDRRDEMWDGELHMVPQPAPEHQDLNDWLGTFFKTHWQARGEGRTFPDVGVKPPGVKVVRVAGEKRPKDYRVPDRSFLLPERYDRLRGAWIVGGPDVVLEILSPGDESVDKLPFYFDLGVREVIFIDRDSREVTIYRRGKKEFVATAAEKGWTRSHVLATELRRKLVAKKPVLHLRRIDEPSRELEIPSD
jgi:Uma2 family endonuclease